MENKFIIMLDGRPQRITNELLISDLSSRYEIYRVFSSDTIVLVKPYGESVNPTLGADLNSCCTMLNSQAFLFEDEVFYSYPALAKKLFEIHREHMTEVFVESQGLDDFVRPEEIYSYLSSTGIKRLEDAILKWLINVLKLGYLEDSEVLVG